MEILSAKARGYLVGAIRKGWRFYSQARKDCLKSKQCALCKSKDRLYADHIDPVGKFEADKNQYIVRMFCNRENLQAICGTCHDKKTALERKARKKK